MNTKALSNAVPFGFSRRLHHLHNSWAQLVVLLSLLAISIRTNAALSVQSGTATAAADLGSSPILGMPPSGPSSFNIFWSSSDVAIFSGGSLGAQGWASSSWAISQTRLYAAGGSSQGFNGALGTDGWIYGWGHASFSATISLDGAYRYSSTIAPLRIRGIRGNNGFLSAGVYTVTGTTYGNSGGFSFDYQLTPATPAQDQVLKGAISAPVVDWHQEKQRYYITISFRPQNGADLQSAAAMLGVDHFNFVNLITSVPRDWQITDNGQVVVPGDGTFPFEGIPDPLPHASSGSGRVVKITNPLNPHFWFPVHMTFEAGKFDDTTGAYYNEAYAINAAKQNPYELQFHDSPSATRDLFKRGDYQAFSTQLVGKDANGNIVAYFGAPIPWWSDQVEDANGSVISGRINFSTFVDSTNLHPVVDGSIHIGVPPTVIQWDPLPIPYGTRLGSNQLNAVATVPGWFTYSPTNGTILSAGTNILTVVFNPQDTANYDRLTNSVNLVVTPAALTVIAANASRPYGTTNPVFAGMIAGVTNGDNITAAYTCTAGTNSPAGVYPIKPALNDPNHRATNYTVTLINGTLTIGASPVNLLTNPGFEQTTAGWTFAGNSGITPAPHTGANAAFVNIANGSISQAIATVPGNLYLISFWLGANGFSAPGAVITASFGGTTGFSNVYPAGAFSYRPASFTAVASGSNSLFTFSGVMSGGTFFLDDVSVTQLATNGIAITSQPAGDSVHVGESASFQAAALGNPPLSYQWFFNGTNAVANATNNILVLPSVAPTNAGGYQLVVTGPSGSVASEVATLSVLGVPVYFSSSALQFSNGSLSLQISGLTGQGSVIVEVSSNLTHWTAIFTNPPAFGTMRFMDTNIASHLHRFYRATVSEP